MSTDLHWFKSSYSGSEGECLEVAMQWTKSSYSGSQGGECVEIAIAQTAPATPTTIHIRDSKTPTAPTLKVTPTPWATFLAHVAAS
ncbi:hypothetical protein QFZ24_004532 [Streptomyces phaeochromogenes]|jgi:hypothetical protein|uniref:DUF397 domain-containing protein n=1 Tax=Streptomyces phaeochromogenes TaxID=1923 RepID=UPI002790D54E|nr:DUF397 domain-containing protein [Streptomyces phaeochromogenes]MDQ0950609.1 hypothetical protein [Streptomyces phaeochromogenes]